MREMLGQIFVVSLSVFMSTNEEQSFGDDGHEQIHHEKHSHHIEEEKQRLRSPLIAQRRRNDVTVSLSDGGSW